VTKQKKEHFGTKGDKMSFILLLSIVFILLYGISLAKDSIALVEEINTRYREQIEIERMEKWEKLKQKNKVS
jgi:hypothetical protein